MFVENVMEMVAVVKTVQMYLMVTRSQMSVGRASLPMMRALTQVWTKVFNKANLHIYFTMNFVYSVEDPSLEHNSNCHFNF